MTKYTVSLQAHASLYIDVEIDESDLDAQQARDAAIEAAYENSPGGVCAQCSGWGQHTDQGLSWELDLGDFEVDDDATAVRRADS